MTRVEFFFNVSNKLEKSAELCEKAVAKGRQLRILTQNDVMSQQMQIVLWHYSETSFLPSSLASEANAQFSPIVIHENGDNLYQDDVLINLQNEQPSFFGRFRYLAELVGNEEEDKVAARARFRFYKDRGYEVKSTDTSVVK
jgi:DNA polymerase III subunit chi